MKNELQELRERLAAAERMVITLTAERDAYLRVIERGGAVKVDANPLDELTLKQHAALLCMVTDMTYEEAARHMQVDSTTVKLHIRAVCKAFGVHTKGQLIAAIRPKIDQLGEKYQARYGIGQKWWLSKAPEALFVRRGTVAVNQHTKKRSHTNGAKRTRT